METLNLDKNTIRIIQDLVEKYPKGPRGCLLKSHYELVRKYVSAYRRETSVPRIREAVGPGLVEAERKPFFGYDPVDFYKMGLRDETQCVAAVRVAFPETTRTAARRDGRRLWIRLEPVFDWIRVHGTTGIWHAKYSQANWRAILGRGIFFYASTRAEVEAQAALVAPMMGALPDWRPYVTFERMGTAAEAMAKNTAAIEGPVLELQVDVAKLERELDQRRRNLEEERSRAGKLMGAIMLSSTTYDDDEEAQESQTTAA